MEIISVNVGKPKTTVYNGKELVTGINKSPVSSALFLAKTNLEGDGQADLENHGGEDKALCVYCEEHYAYWADQMDKPLEYGAFGENLTVRGLLESEVCIGDKFKLGEAVVQVTQPRQPCHKLAGKHGDTELPLHVQNTGFSGYYFRVVKEGALPVRPRIRLMEKHPAGVSVEYANQIMHHKKEDIAGMQRILAVPELSASWRSSFEKRLARLEGIADA